MGIRTENTAVMPAISRTDLEVQNNELANEANKKDTRVPVCEKYTLTIKEAAAYFNFGIKKMRRLAEENTGRFSVFCFIGNFSNRQK